MFRPHLAWLSLLLCIASPVRAITHITATTLAASATWGPTGTVVDTEFWIEPASGSTYTINSGVTLTIQPGTTVRLNGGVSLVVNGTLAGSGTVPSPMVFAVTPAFSQWGGITLGAAGSLALNGCTIRDFGTYPVRGTAPQVATLFPNNIWVARVDGHYNAILLLSSSIGTSLTLPQPPAGFCYYTEPGCLLEVRGAGGPVFTIASGTVIKFNTGSLLRVGFSGLAGALNASGVVFTSSEDDTLGDTGNDGVTVGAAGQWRDIRLESATVDATTIIDHCIVRYAGETDAYAILVADAQPTITNSTIRDNLGYGLLLTGTSTAAAISGNLLRDNTSFEISAPPVGIGNLFVQNTVAPSASGTLNGYRLQGGGISANLTLPKPQPGFCYYTEPGAILEVRAAGGPVLTIADGTVIKFNTGSLVRVGFSGLAGALRAKGVVFTSTSDDTLGDTNNNGPSVGAAGQWRDIRFESATVNAATQLDSCIVRYAGETDAYGVLVADAEPAITRCVIRDNLGYGLLLTGTSTAAAISGNLLRDNTSFEISAPPVGIGKLFLQNTVAPSASGTLNGYHLQGGGISANLTLPKPLPGFCYYTEPGALLEVRGAGGPVLTIADGTVIKFHTGSLVRVGFSGLSGALRAKGVVFTSTSDDTLGDTNNNGPSVGAAGQWRDIRFESATLNAATQLDSCIVRYAGETDAYGILVADAEPLVTRCVIRDNLGYGLLLTGTSTAATISGNLLRDNTSFEISAPPQGIGNLFLQNTVAPSASGTLNGYRLQGGGISANLTLPKPLPGFCYYTEPGALLEVRGAGGPVLTIADGTVIKFNTGSLVRVGFSGLAGGLRAKGVLFTSTSDDTLGDTNNNGPSVGAAGQWRDIRFESATLDAATTLDGCIVRYAGETDAYAILVADAEPVITGCAIRSNSGYGLLLSNTSSGTAITSNLLRDNTSFEVSAQLAPIARLAKFNDIRPSRDGRLNGYYIQGGTTSGAIVMPRPPVTMAYYMSASVTVPAGASLSIPGGCVFKMEPAVRLLVQGTLTVTGKVDFDPLAPVMFTSYRDDKWWGDTNGDGPTTGAAGDWQRIEITGGNNASVVDGAIFSFGGSGALGQLYVNGTGAQATPNVTIKNSHFYLTSAVTGVRTSNSNARLDSCSFFGGTTMLGVSNVTPAISVVASHSWWGHFTGPYDPSVVDPCTNPAGLGVGVSDNVDYCPFLTTGAPVTDAPPPVVGPSRMGIAWVGPVPARTEVSVMLGVPSEAPGTLEFLDPSGRIVRRMTVQGAPGSGALMRWDLADERGGRVAPGIYFARYRHGGISEVRRVVLAR